MPGGPVKFGSSGLEPCLTELLGGLYIERSSVEAVRNIKHRLESLSYILEGVLVHLWLIQRYLLKLERRSGKTEI